jgi:DnaJ like chaperone protein
VPIWRRLSEIISGATLETVDADRAGACGADDTLLARAERARALVPSALPDLGATFTMAVVALSAKMAKADGVVVPLEVDCFDRMFQIPATSQSDIKRFFQLAAADTAGFETYASQVRRLLNDDAMMLRHVLESLFQIASADRAMHPSEMTFLETVAARFGLSDSTFRHIRAQFVSDPESPYDVLGLDPNVSDDTLKTRYRKLVRENHPDLVVAQGLPADIVAVATRKVAAITDAYSAIAKERGL